ncbi:DUF485 domain-containing protein [Streptomyces sp. NPDC002306]
MSFDSSELHPAQHRPGRHAFPAWAPDPLTARDGDPPAVRPRSWTSRHRDFRLLRRACRWQRRVATFAALGYFAAFLTLTVEAPSIMTRPAPGGLPLGLVLALVQLPVTWLAVILYEYTARRYVDPLARRVHRQTYRADGEQQP